MFSKLKSKRLLKIVAASKKLKAGSANYRAYVGPAKQFDFMGASQFMLLFMLGLREEHKLLDIGCGSLRAGKFFIQYLLPEKYYGHEPNQWLWKRAFEAETGECVKSIKRPKFSDEGETDFTTFGTSFDYIVAQSVLSHMGENLFNDLVSKIPNVLNPGGQFLFTVLDEKTGAYSRLPTGSQFKGWRYPGCVGYSVSEVLGKCEEAGLFVQRIDWFHPRQSWYRAVGNKEELLDEDQLLELKTGRPLNYDE